MDEAVLNELLECSVCLERLDESSKVLPCQHTFCRRCLDEIVSTKKELRCPECRALVEIPVEELMSNILLIRLLEGLKNAKSGVSVAGPSVSPTSQGSPRGPASPTHPSHSPVGPSASCSSRTSPAHRIITPSQPCCKALYNYEAKEPGDLSFKKGDLILLRKQVDDNWYHGELRGQYGFFPATYVQVITPLPEEVPKCKALYDFMVSDKNEKDCLTFRKDETVVVIRRVDENWAEGKISDRIGIFPISFVEMNDAAKWLINNPAIANRSAVGSPQSNNSSNSPTSPPRGLPESTSTPSSLASLILPSTSIMPPVTGTSNTAMINPSLMAVQRAGQKRHSLTAISSHKVAAQQQPQQQHRHSMELSGTNFSADMSMSTGGEALSTSQPASLTSSPKTTASQVPQGSTGANCDVVLTTIYIALYNYKPRKDDEVDLKKGEYYTVSEKCQDGWFKGTCLRTGATGVFPGNYVQQVKFTKHANGGGSGRIGAVQSVRPSGIPGKANHVTVSRAHSFPKTSPMAMVTGDYQVKAGSQGIITRPPNVTVSCVHPANSFSHTGPSMTSSMIQTPSASSSGVLGHVVSGSDPMSASTPSGQLSGLLEKPVPPRSSQRSPRSSPRSNRKSERLKKDHSRNPLHSMMSSSSITPSDAIGAVGGERHSEPTEHHKPHKEHKERKERKEKDKLSIVKRLAKVKKSKSPPPDLCASSSHRISHNRSGSAPGDSEGATALTHQYKSRSLEHHQKSRSLDSNTHPPSTKPMRTKPLLRERHRCVVPYPPQSDIELELKLGDIVYVHKKREDGWFKGTLQRSGKTGLFPGSFVESF